MLWQVKRTGGSSLAPPWWLKKQQKHHHKIMKTPARGEARQGLSTSATSQFFQGVTSRGRIVRNMKK
jgi:hypothetical protein